MAEEELYNAAKWGRTEEVKDIIDQFNVDVNKAINGKTALEISAIWGFWDTVELLMEKGAVPNETILNKVCYTSPRYCKEGSDVYYNNHSVPAKHDAYRLAVRLMQDMKKTENLIYAPETVNDDYKICVNYNIIPGCDIPDSIMNILIYYNHLATALTILRALYKVNNWTKEKLCQEIEKHHQILLQHRKEGEDPTEMNGRKLYNAASYGDESEVQKILHASSIDINWKNEYGNTALYIAAAWGMQNVKMFYSSEKMEIELKFDKTIELLINKGADVNVVNNDGKSVLYIAASWGSWKIVELLLQKGAIDNQSKSAIGIATYIVPRGPGADDVDDNDNDNAGKEASKNYRFRMAKEFMEIVMAKGKYSDILTTVEEDYKTLINLKQQISSSIMNIVRYYIYFATVTYLLKAKNEDESTFLEKLKELNCKLLKHREEVQAKIKELTRMECD